MAQMVWYNGFNKIFTLFREDTIVKPSRYNGYELCPKHRDDDETFRHGSALYLSGLSENKKQAIYDFFGVERLQDHDSVFRCELKVVFCGNGLMALYPARCKDPIRVKKIYHTERSQYFKEWATIEDYLELHQKGAVALHYWKFPKDTPYIIASHYRTSLWGLIPEITRDNLTFHSLYSSHSPNSWKLLQIKLWELDPYDLNNSYDYTDEIKAEKKRQKELEEQRKREHIAQIERQKSLDGYCDYCGAPHALHITEPFDEDMNNYRHLVWICRDCYESHLGDI